MHAGSNHPSPRRIKTGGSPLLPPAPAPSSPARAMECNAACLLGSIEGLPDSPWDLFCAINDIDESDWARELLDKVAEKWEEHNGPGLRGMTLALAEAKGKDPNIVLLWKLLPKFRGESTSAPARDEQTQPDNFYLLTVMKEECRTSVKNWTTLAEKIMKCKQC